MLCIHSDECIDCGLSAPECPVTAMFQDADVPADQKQYLRINEDAFKSAPPPQRPTH